MIPSIVCPATCELCGNWLPQHQDSCPRNGVHPSQWTCSLTPEHEHEHEHRREQDYHFNINNELLYPQDFKHDNHYII